MKVFVCFLTILLVLTACSGSSKDYIESYDKITYNPSSYVFYETTLDGLENRVPNIVKGRILSDASPVFQYSNSNNEDRPAVGYTKVSLEVLEVIKGDFSIGDVVMILEPYYIYENVLYTSDNYLPSKPGQEYFFFLWETLVDNMPEGYENTNFVVHGERGRYLVPSSKEADIQKKSAKELSLGELDTDLYRSLYQDVIDAYMK